MKTLRVTTLLLLAMFAFTSCETDDSLDPINEDDGITEPLGDFENGILITNEGPFGTGTGTVSFISNDLATVQSSIFNTVNGTDLGNIVQSMAFDGDNGYIVVNNSHLIKVVNRYTFEEVTTIDAGLENPRFFVAAGNFGYVTNWGDPFVETDDFIAVIDLTTNTVTATIPVGFGPEKLVYNGDKIYVAHKGGFGQNNIISVIDPEGNTVESTIDVGFVPNSLVLSGPDLWVLSGGKPEFTGDETAGSLAKINIDGTGPSNTFDFSISQHPEHLSINGADLYYNLDGNVFKMNVADTELSTDGIIAGFFYAMAINEGKLFATDAVDFASDGTLTVFDLIDNSEITTLTVGLIPGGIYFND